MATRIKDLAKIREQAKKAFYVNAEWITSSDEIFTLKEWASLIDDSVNYIAGNATIVAKVNQESGETFLKAEFPLKSGDTGEFNLKFKDHGFSEGDILDFDTFRFCIERKLGKTHPYMTGEVL